MDPWFRREGSDGRDPGGSEHGIRGCVDEQTGVRLDLITARHVLSHTAGFQDIRSSEKPLKIQFNPGEKWMYSGEGYFYLQSVLTELTGHVNPGECSRFEADFEVPPTSIRT